MPNDHKTPKLTAKQQELAQLLRYIDERFQNQTEQIRAVAMACGVSPETFQKFFVDEEAQDQFYIKLHVAEDNYALQKKKELAAETPELGQSPSGTPNGIDANIGAFVPSAFSEEEGVQGDESGTSI